ncbi:MAG TPA: hypothetical protein VLE96_01510, partial [Chlamydiales bacterium]|nr:hypothetical protein [Chlamydiales bacterium]
MKFLIGLILAIQSFTFVHADERCAKAEWVLDYVKTISDFPSQGFTFKWYSPLLKDPVAFKRVIHIFADRYRDSGIDAIVGLDSRGFIWGSALAYELNIPFVVE